MITNPEALPVIHFWIVRFSALMITLPAEILNHAKVLIEIATPIVKVSIRQEQEAQTLPMLYP